MEKKGPLADHGESSSPYREVDLSDAQNAFQEIVNVLDGRDCSCQPKPDLTKQIKLIADEIVKSKIRDKILLSSRNTKTDLSTKFSQVQINSNKGKQESDLSNLKNQITSQANSIANQATYIGALMDATKIKTGEIKTLSKEIKTLSGEIETLKLENARLAEKNEELLAQVNEFLH